MLLSFNVWKTFGMFALSAVLGFCIVTSTDRRAEAQQPSSNGCAMLLEPLDTLHQDLQRIEEKLDALANPKWEYKILTPNVIDEDAVDRYSPNLTPLGEQGWELVNYSSDIGYVMKRRVTRPQIKR
ncbi:MAG: hypothetical protein BA863_06555 [Desulfovibrio sp. S3730MH75]|nr:MAG: hypothetical protein BA863_06555 [Desulfovibrio sp. S3730MH75]